MEPVIAVLSVLLMLVGLIGVVIPVMPGLLLVWLVSTATTLWVGTDLLGWSIAGLLTLFFAAGTAATIWLPTRQGIRGGAPKTSVLSALAGASVGFFLIPVAGFLIGGLGGFVLAEYRRLGDTSATIRSLTGMLRAYGIGVLIELMLGLAMIGTWAIAMILR